MNSVKITINIDSQGFAQKPGDIKDLNFIINSTDGVYGGRFMGGGFNGCCLAIIDPSKKEEIKNTISTRYLTLHPEMKELFGMFDCVSGDGIGE